MAFREIYRGNTVKFGLGIPDHRSGGQRYKNYPKSQVQLQHVEPSPIYIPPSTSVMVEVAPEPVVVPEVDLVAVAAALDAHFHDPAPAIVEPVEVSGTGLSPEEIESGGFLESYVTEWHPRARGLGRGILRRWDGTHYAFAEWEIKSVGAESLKKGCLVYHQMGTDRHGAPVAVNVWIVRE